MKYTAIIEGQRLEIELTQSGSTTLEAETASRKYVIETTTVEPGVYWFNWNNQSIEVSVTPNGEGYAVSIGGRSIPIEILDARNALRRAAQQGQAGAVELRAPMPGKIVKVLVNEGAEVHVNQGLLVIEAMKMQNEIKSPKNGVVKRIGAKEGAPVNPGDVLAIVE